jgi:hypothetical protein
MADIIINPVAGVPFSGSIVYKDMTGAGGPYAPVSLSVAGFVPLASLTAVSATGPGVALDNQGVRNNHNLVVNTTGTVTSGAVQLQGSQDNVNWINLLTTALAPLSSSAPVTSGVTTLTPFRYLRANVTTVIGGGGTITAYVASAG